MVIIFSLCLKHPFTNENVLIRLLLLLIKLFKRKQIEFYLGDKQGTEIRGQKNILILAIIDGNLVTLSTRESQSPDYGKVGNGCPTHIVILRWGILILLKDVEQQSDKPKALT